MDLLSASDKRAIVFKLHCIPSNVALMGGLLSFLKGRSLGYLPVSINRKRSTKETHEAGNFFAVYR